MSVQLSTIGIDIDLTREGLPCRGGCDEVFPAAETVLELFLASCQKRIDHEMVAHGYVHHEHKPLRAFYSWKPSRRLSFS